MAVATALTLTGPTTGSVNAPSAVFTATLSPGGGTATAVIVTFASTVAGTFSPATVTLSTGTPAATTVYTPTAAGVASITETNDSGLTDAAALPYTVTADLVASGVPSLSTAAPDTEHRLSGLYAGEAITAGAPCYVKSDGKVWLSVATASTTDASNVVDGFAAAPAAVGASVTLYYGVRFSYATGLTPGTYYYLSAATGGRFALAAVVGSPHPIARSIDASRLEVVRSY